jgi:anti-sigma factor (TIGR02949 family)
VSEKHHHGSENCKEIFARLSDYLDGDLPEDLCKRIEGHMNSCPPCEAFMKSLERTVRLVESLETPAMPAEVRRAVREAWERCRDEPD